MAKSVISIPSVLMVSYISVYEIICKWSKIACISTDPITMKISKSELLNDLPEYKKMSAVNVTHFLCTYVCLVLMLMNITTATIFMRGNPVCSAMTIDVARIYII